VTGDCGLIGHRNLQSAINHQSTVNNQQSHRSRHRRAASISSSTLSGSSSD
jgi:hypothetical protein